VNAVRTRTYTYRGPVGAAARRRGREHHELVVRDGAPGAAPPCELDGRPVSRDAAWGLSRRRRSRRGVGAGCGGPGGARRRRPGRRVAQRGQQVAGDAADVGAIAGG
jgi:hypothetical protein